jgi:hypothetical protein
MTVATLVLLAVTAVGGLLLAAVGERVRPQWGGALLTLLLAIAALLAWRAGPAGSGLVQLADVVAVLAAVAGGGPVASAVLRSADPTSAATAGGPGDPEVLRGGAWVGVLERAALAGTLLAGWPEGLAVVIAVKGLGRYAELKAAPAAAERFIIGTLASLLWAAGCVGCVVLLRR